MLFLSQGNEQDCNKVVTDYRRWPPFLYPSKLAGNARELRPGYQLQDLGADALHVREKTHWTVDRGRDIKTAWGWIAWRMEVSGGLSRDGCGQAATGSNRETYEARGMAACGINFNPLIISWKWTNRTNFREVSGENSAQKQRTASAFWFWSRAKSSVN